MGGKKKRDYRSVQEMLREGFDSNFRFRINGDAAGETGGKGHSLYTVKYEAWDYKKATRSLWRASKEE